MFTVYPIERAGIGGRSFLQDPSLRRHCPHFKVGCGVVSSKDCGWEGKRSDGRAAPDELAALSATHTTPPALVSL